MRVGILTGGGDTQPLNAAIRTIVKYGEKRYGDEFLGIKYGWGGLVPESMAEKEKEVLEERELESIQNRIIKLNSNLVSGLLNRGGTILGSSRANPLKLKDGLKLVKQRFEELKLKALIAIGGEGTLSVAYKLFMEVNLPVVGIPKTIDNDVFGTDSTLGFTTAYSMVADWVDNLHTTAESHHMIHILEVMGRKAGWIALRGGIAGGADIILIPEYPLSIDEICELIEERREKGKKFSIIVVAEGFPLEGEVVKTNYKDPYGHERLGGVAERLAEILRQRTKFDVRCQRPGHLQRAGRPAPYDRWLATRMGIRAVDLVHNSQFGRMVAVSRNEIVDIELREAASGNRLVPRELFEELKWLFG